MIKSFNNFLVEFRIKSENVGVVLLLCINGYT